VGFSAASLIELSLDCIFASLGRELKSGRGDNPLEFSCSVPVVSPRKGYILVPVKMTARLNTSEEGVFAVVSFRDEARDR